MEITSLWGLLILVPYGIKFLKQWDAYKIWYKYANDFVKNFGRTISKFGTNKVGKVAWIPIEEFFMDFIFRLLESFREGLLEDNEKIEKEIRTLEELGSKNRLKAMKNRNEEMKNG